MAVGISGDLKNGHRERLRQKYLNGGYKGFLDYELLELLLTYSIERRDVKVIAKSLLEEFKSIENVVKSDREDLLKVKGVGPNTAIFLNLIGDIATNIYENKLVDKDITSISNKNDLLAYLKGNIAFNSAEQFMVMFLDNTNKIIANKVLFTGTIDRSAIYPREIIKYVLKYEAKSIIFAHNHPAGSINPSVLDVDFTKKIYNTLKELDIRLFDHIIITKDGYYSFLENGLI